MAEQELAEAVLLQAQKDASIRKDCFDRRSARNFLCGTSRPWLESLELWCSLAEISLEAILESSRRKWRPDLLKEVKCQRN